MVGLRVSFLLLALASSVPEWSRFEAAYNQTRQEKTEGWYRFREWQDDPGLKGDLSNWLLFKNAREDSNRLLAYHYSRRLLERGIPEILADEALGFVLRMHHEVGGYEELVREYEAHRLKTSAGFQRQHRVIVAYAMFRSKNGKHEKLFQSILRSGPDRDRVELFLLMKGKASSFNTRDLMTVLEAATTLQRWDAADKAGRLLDKRKLDRKEKNKRAYLNARRFFRNEKYDDALTLFQYVARHSRGSLREKARYQAGRCCLFLRREASAEKIFESVGGNLESVADLTLGRLAVQKGDWKRAERAIGKIKREKNRRRLRLLLAVAWIRQGYREKASKILASLPGDAEVNYWTWKAQPLSSRPPSLGMSYFTYTVWKDRHLPPRTRENLCIESSAGIPHTLIEYLTVREYPELTFPYVETLFSGRDEQSRCDRAKLYLAAGFPSRSIKHLWREQLAFQDKEPWAWPSDLRELTFPLEFQQEVRQAASRWKVPEDLLFSVIRQESSFDHTVHSSAGAWGLMQLMPVTASSMVPEALDLMDTKINVDLGARYLSELHKKYGQWEHAVAAYNAGTGAVDLWIEQLGSAGMDYFFTFIPYIETKRYVDRVFSGRLMYRVVMESDKK